MTGTLHQIGIAALSVFCSVSFVCTLFQVGAHAQTYPAKPLRMVVTNAPGSGADVIARLIGSHLGEALGQPIVTDNRAGASGRIGMEAGARSAPDGYNLLMVTSSNVVASAMFDNLKYDLVKDFSPISLIGMTPFIFVVNPSVPATTVTELVALAKSQPGKLKYGQGSESQHLSAEIFKSIAGCDILNVPYKGSSAAVTGTMGGEVHMTFQAIPTVSALIKSGKLRALGITSAKRTSLAPDIPAISESAPGYEYSGWYALFAPAKTPAPILSRLHAEVVKVLEGPVMRERLAVLGVDPLGSTPQECAAYLQSQMEKMKEAVKMAGLRTGQ
ncbi:MAG: tripartite tricarboxylate transporter substrate binding protein [Thermodesulfobacteriota bacterium]